ncbi:unnamed protein product, partial [Mesorhabditis belari]|uniref:Apple domain-containing protein n=1 Tax=Mesorhabditis belari TaxID=2138241 RepID=A0AAF3ESW2_9BILA
MSMRWRSLIANLISIIALWTNCNADPDVFSCFLLYSNRYLQRSGAVFIGNLSSPSECLERCLQANRLNFLECRSVMWRRDTNDCVLSRHRRVARRVNETKVIEKSFENNEWAKDQRTTIPIKEIDEKILKESINQIFVAASGFISSTPDPNSLVNVLSRKRAKVFASTQSVPLHPITLNDITGTTTIDSMPISNDFSGNSRRSHVEPSPIQPLVTNPLNRTALNLQKQMIDSPIRLNTFYKNSKKSIPFSSVESFDSRSNAVAVSGDTIPSKVSPIRTNVNTHAHVFRRKQNELTRNVRGSVILIPAKGANPSPPTIAPAITTNTIKAIRPGPITRHYYKPNSKPICIVNGGSSSQTRTALQTSKTIDYYENVCPPAQPRTPDQLIIPSFIISRCLTPIVNTILEDLDASLVTSAQTLEECQTRF